MAEIGKNQTWDSQGNLISEEEYLISDDKLLVQELDKQSNDIHPLAIQAYKNWDSLTPPQKDKILKHLLGYYISSAQKLGYFKIE